MAAMAATADLEAWPLLETPGRDQLALVPRDWTILNSLHPMYPPIPLMADPALAAMLMLVLEARVEREEKAEIPRAESMAAWASPWAMVVEPGLELESVWRLLAKAAAAAAAVREQMLLAAQLWVEMLRLAFIARAMSCWAAAASLQIMLLEDLAREEMELAELEDLVEPVARVEMPPEASMSEQALAFPQAAIRLEWGLASESRLQAMAALEETLALVATALQARQLAEMPSLEFMHQAI
jgi:hypothetical protein